MLPRRAWVHRFCSAGGFAKGGKGSKLKKEAVEGLNAHGPVTAHYKAGETVVRARPGRGSTIYIFNMFKKNDRSRGRGRPYVPACLPVR